MTASWSSVVAHLRAELASEVAAGFPRLRRVPHTEIIWFLDYFAGLAPAEQKALLDALARFSATPFFPRQAPPQHQEPERDPAFARFRAAHDRPGSRGGTRYTGVKMLSMDPSLKEIGGYHESWKANFTDLNFQPRADLLPDLGCLKSAKAPLLRKLVKGVLQRLGFVSEKGRLGGEPKYVGSFGTSAVTVWVDFGSYNGQLCYGVTVANPEHPVPVSRLSYERLWGAVLGWDYLTEENAPRSIDFFGEQILYLAQLGEQVNR